MPRQARLDIPGALHHVIIKCTEKQKIVRDRSDRNRLLKQMGNIALESGTIIYAWAMLPNQVHILLRSGSEGLAPYMRRLLTSHAVTFNRRYRRHGSLFQGRYKSTVCEEKLFFRELVRYIHLRPLKQKIVRTMAELDKHPWCGHAAVLGDAGHAWHDRAYVLQSFGRRPAEAKKAYRLFLGEGMRGDDGSEFNGGGLVRSVGGWDEVKALRKKKRRMASDARILGSNAFVRKILKQAEKLRQPRIRGAKLRRKIETIIRETCKKAGVNVTELQAGSRRGIVPAIRLQLALRLTKEMDVTLVDASRHLGVTPSALSKALTRARKAF